MGIDDYVVPLGSADPQKKADWIEDQIKKEQEDIKLREWEAKFDQKQKEKEAEERLKDQRIKQKEMHAQMLKEQKEQNLNEELSSRLENFEVKQTREN